jgi:hypothetical protein
VVACNHNGNFGTEKPWLRSSPASPSACVCGVDRSLGVKRLSLGTDVAIEVLYDLPERCDTARRLRLLKRCLRLERQREKWESVRVLYFDFWKGQSGLDKCFDQCFMMPAIVSLNSDPADEHHTPD